MAIKRHTATDGLFSREMLPVDLTDVTEDDCEAIRQGLTALSTTARIAALDKFIVETPASDPATSLRLDLRDRRTPGMSVLELWEQIAEHDSADDPVYVDIDRNVMIEKSTGIRQRGASTVAGQSGSWPALRALQRAFASVPVSGAPGRSTLNRRASDWAKAISAGERRVSTASRPAAAPSTPCAAARLSQV